MEKYEKLLKALKPNIYLEDGRDVAVIVQCTINPWEQVAGEEEKCKADVLLIAPQENTLIWCYEICTGDKAACLQAAREFAPLIEKRFPDVSVELRSEIFIERQKPLSDEEADAMLDDLSNEDLGLGVNPEEPDFDLTFEEVLEEFTDYLKDDTDAEVVVTKRAHAFMLWDDVAKDWQDVVCCLTPEDLYEVLEENKNSYYDYIKKYPKKENPCT